MPEYREPGIYVDQVLQCHDCHGKGRRKLRFQEQMDSRRYMGAIGQCVTCRGSGKIKKSILLGEALETLNVAQ